MSEIRLISENLKEINMENECLHITCDGERYRILLIIEETVEPFRMAMKLENTDKWFCCNRKNLERGCFADGFYGD